MAEAQKTAQEMEGAEADGNIHVAEERGKVVDRKGLDDAGSFCLSLSLVSAVARAGFPRQILELS